MSWITSRMLKKLMLCVKQFNAFFFFEHRANWKKKRVSRASDVWASGGRDGLAAAAKLMRFISRDGHYGSRLPGTHKLTANTSERRLEMLSTLFYSPLRKLILLIDCCPWLPTRSQGEQIEMYCGAAGGERGSLAQLFCKQTTTTTKKKRLALLQRGVIRNVFTSVLIYSCSSRPFMFANILNVKGPVCNIKQRLMVRKQIANKFGHSFI